MILRSHSCAWLDQRELAQAFAERTRSEGLSSPAAQQVWEAGVTDPDSECILHKDFYRNTPFSATSFSDDFDIMSSSGIRARSVDAHSDGASSRQPSTIQKGTVRSGVDTPASLSSSSDSRESVSEGLRAHSHLHGENHAESVRNIDTSPHASLVTAADLATCLAENTVRSAKT